MTEGRAATLRELSEQGNFFFFPNEIQDVLNPPFLSSSHPLKFELRKVKESPSHTALKSLQPYTISLCDVTVHIHITNFYVLLTLHPNIMIVFVYQLDAQILYFNTFIKFLYMFRALLCSSSGGQLY